MPELAEKMYVVVSLGALQFSLWSQTCLSIRWFASTEDYGQTLTGLPCRLLLLTS